jgi:outer membrane cobalamin receptor
MNLRILLPTLLILTLTMLYPARGNGDTNSPKYTISGYIKDANDGEMLIGATVYIENTKTGSSANAYGFYSLSLPPGQYTLSYSYIGYKSQKKDFNLKSDISVNIDLIPEQKTIGEVVIKGEKVDANVKKAEMSVAKLDMMTIKKIPALMGEVDLVKVIQMLPGVVPTSEGTSGFSVRGGGNDQNLVILDEATVYNASHLMGFFSVFNNDAIRDVKLYKGDIPANYGGRLSSVLDVRMKEGNNKKISLTGGIGLISSRLTVEGPIGNEKTSFLISGRRSYADLFFIASKDTGLQKSKMYFYDLNLKLNHELNENNRFYLSAYLGRDKFGQKGTSDFSFGNQTVTLRWNHLFSRQLFSNLSAIRAKYDYALMSDGAGAKYVWNSGLLDYTLKLDFNYFANPNNEIKFGAATIYHDIKPCDAWMENEGSKITVPFPKNYELEYALYISNQQKIGEHLTLKYGLRYSIFQNMGKTTVYKYNSGYEVSDTLYYNSGEVYHTYQGFEPRFGLNYVLNDRSSVKASYSRTIQFMQLASNSNGGMPLDVWFPASPNIKPQKADQYSVGYFRNLNNNNIETSVEVFYKKMYDVIDFKDHAELLMNPRMEGEIRTGNAQAYGTEFLVRKNEGKITGWVSYTLSKATRKIPEINDGKTYNSPYDKPHTINVVLNYQASRRSQFAVSWVYATGSPMTAPVGSFEYGNTVNKIYADRNGYRMRDYHRLDLSYTLAGKEKPGRAWQGEWNFSVYNAYGRHNDWIINFTPDKNDPSKVVSTRWYLPFVFFPSVTYNFKF